QEIVARFKRAKRPVLMLGGGVSRATAKRIGVEGYQGFGVPIMTTWNGADRIGSEHPLYFGRPNTWGQRYANILAQQADFVLALGTRLGMQQSGFNWQQFIPLGDIVQVDLDPAELAKGHPEVAQGLSVDANDLLLRLQAHSLGEHGEWIAFCRSVRAELPLVEPGVNVTGEGYISPYTFFDELSRLSRADDVLIPCSSGGAFTCSYQSISQKFGQHYVTDKSLASMGYGLSGAIGAALANPDKRTILIEGDGGFAQNLQEVGTAAINKLNLKMFVFDDKGYASIRMTQRSYFGGRYVGCDIATGLGLPDWSKLFAAYDVPVLRVGPGFEASEEFLAAFNAQGVHAFLVAVDPEQTYFPKISSRVRADGGMESNPLHRMTPDLPEEQYQRVAKYLVAENL
ncbi:thiamine pyrophosphate-binding protein, partial [Uliginosibacterium sediminicola]